MTGAYVQTRIQKTQMLSQYLSSIKENQIVTPDLIEKFNEAVIELGLSAEIYQDALDKAEVNI